MPQELQAYRVLPLVVGGNIRLTLSHALSLKAPDHPELAHHLGSAGMNLIDDDDELAGAIDLNDMDWASSEDENTTPDPPPLGPAEPQLGGGPEAPPSAQEHNRAQTRGRVEHGTPGHGLGHQSLQGAGIRVGSEGGAVVATNETVSAVSAVLATSRTISPSPAPAPAPAPAPGLAANGRALPAGSGQGGARGGARGGAGHASGVSSPGVPGAGQALPRAMTAALAAGAGGNGTRTKGPPRSSPFSLKPCVSCKRGKLGGVKCRVDKRHWHDPDFTAPNSGKWVMPPSFMEWYMHEHQGSAEHIPGGARAGSG
ncbi:unnamed protein product, partial [Discosporangium mesarthrocarpum]